LCHRLSWWINKSSLKHSYKFRPVFGQEFGLNSTNHHHHHVEIEACLSKIKDAPLRRVFMASMGLSAPYPMGSLLQEWVKPLPDIVELAKDRVSWHACGMIFKQPSIINIGQTENKQT